MSKIEINKQLVETWLVEKVAALTRMNKDKININNPIHDYGLDSVHAVGLSGDIEDWLNIEIEPTAAWDYPTISLMADHIIEEYEVLV